MEIRLTRRFPPPPGPSAQPLAANASNNAVDESAEAALRASADMAARGRERSCLPFACSVTARQYTPRGPAKKHSAGTRKKSQKKRLPARRGPINSRILDCRDARLRRKAELDREPSERGRRRVLFEARPDQLLELPALGAAARQIRGLDQIARDVNGLV